MSQIPTGNGNAPAIPLGTPIPGVTQPPAAPQIKQPGTFRRILGAAVGMAGNMFAPGIGGALGNIIAGGGGGGVINSPFNGGSFGNVLAQGEAQLQQNAVNEQQFLQLQAETSQQAESVQLYSGILSAKHQSAMAVINNMKG